MGTEITSGTRRPEVDSDWADLAALWSIRPDSTYLNHGSFGPSPRPVREVRRQYIDALDSQPMDFYVRQFEPLLLQARDRLAEFLGTVRKNIVFAENATFAMNVVADSFPLQAGDEVLLNDHEYGAVIRIWERRCARTGARVKIVPLPARIESHDQVVDAIAAGITPQTRLTIISEITSPTAIILPVAQIAAACRKRGVAVCVDGPHVPAQIDLRLDDLAIDFYCASLHKWLCAPLGTGFLYAHPRWHGIVQPQLLSWGRLLPALPEQWDEQFTWSGTRDSSLYLSVPAAIDFMTQTVGLETFRRRCYWLADYAREQLMELTGEVPLAPTSGGWYGTMCHVPLPAGDWSQLQNWLWEAHRIEVPIIHFNSRWFVRVSSHLYNTTSQVDRLVRAIASRIAG